jgi:outer membrane lipoprotein
VTLTVRLVIMLLVLHTTGCATGIPRQIRSQVTYHGSFSELRGNIDQHGGEVVMLGGKVIETQGSQTGSQISVLQLPLDRRGRPKDANQSEGRYLIRSGQFFDPAIYEKGTLVTVVGKLGGSEVRSIGGFQYDYPIVEAIEVKPWPREQRTSPRFHFGVGVGKSF